MGGCFSRAMCKYEKGIAICNPFYFKALLNLTDQNLDYQNFHQGFLPAKLLAADALLVAAVALAALVTLSFRRPFSSHLSLHRKRLLQI